MIKKIKAGLLPAVVLLVISAISSCQRYDDPPPYFEINADTVKAAKRKLLIIGIDGAVGSEYKQIQAPVLEGLKPHSKYSWESFSDESTTDAASWKTLLSGASYSKHGIFDSTFVYTQDPNSSIHAAIPNSYPSFFNYILSSAKSDTKSSFISSWPEMVNRAAPEVEDKVFATNDAAVKDSALSRLKNGNADIVLVHFNSVAVAGKANGFSAAAQGYKDAVLNVDGYIGELMAGLKSRPEYNKNEEWLVIITGTHGGAGTTYGGSSASEVNNFSFYYNERFKAMEFLRGGFTSVQIKNKDIFARIPDDGGLYNPNSAQQTVSIKMKCASPFSYPHFFSKMQKFVSSGWSMFTNSSGIWCLSVSGSGESRIQNATPNVFNNQWHTLTFKFMDSASKRWVVRYTDGARNDITDVTARGSVSSTSPLTIGWGADPGYNGITAYFADCMIFNTALSDAEVASLATMPDLKQHPKYNNLIGYWPCNEGYGKAFRNIAPGAVNKDFIISGKYSWDPLADVPRTTPPAISEPARRTFQLKSVDVAATAMYWLRIPANPLWTLDGATWLSQYELEFVKL